MHEENLVSIQQYAIKHKMSTFAVVKLINAKKIKSIKKTVNDEEKEFIIDDTIPVKQTLQTEKRSVQEPCDSKIDYEVEFHKLLAKYIELQEKYTQMIEEKNHAPK